MGTAWFWLFTAQTVPLSVLMTQVYNRNERSILPAILSYFASNFTLGLVYPLAVRIPALTGKTWIGRPWSSSTDRS